MLLRGSVGITVVVILLYSHSSLFVDSRSRRKGSDKDRPIGLKCSYDFIIVGGGTAGCLLANRLSGVKEWNILLIEAGEDETFPSKVPFFPTLSQRTRLDWNFTSTEQANACHSKGGYCEITRGRVLGGSSSINYMTHMRGLQEDYNFWEAAGGPGWSYRELLPLFEKFEVYLTSNDSENTSNRDFMPVTINAQDWLSNGFYIALSEFGLHEADLNAPGSGRGFMLHQANVRDGSRVSANTAFLKPALERPNLDVLTSSLAKKILLHNHKAVGVEFERKKRKYNVFATREVILSAGSINSPQILMLSGIGPAEELKLFGIPVVQNLSVGSTLQDHVGICNKFSIKNKQGTDDDMLFIQQYLYNQTGLLSMTAGRIVALINSSLATAHSPDIELIFERGEEDDEFYVSGFLGKPESRGKLTLSSASPYDPPLIDPNYLSTERDRTVMREMMDIVFELVFSTSLKDLEPSFIAPSPWLCENTTDLMGCLITQYTQTYYHPASTCRMGPATDSYAVVDSELKIHGVRRLRVVDASVMPHLPSTNINTPTLLVAEKASIMIIEEHKKRKQNRSNVKL